MTEPIPIATLAQATAVIARLAGERDEARAEVARLQRAYSDGYTLGKQVGSRDYDGALADCRDERREARAERDRARDFAAGLEAQLAQVAELLTEADTWASPRQWWIVFGVDQLRAILSPDASEVAE